MTPETINGIKEALAPVAEKIGQGAEYGWEILVWGQFAEGVAMLVGGGIGMIICGALLYISVKADWDDVWPVPMCVIGIFGFIIAFLFVANGIIPVIAPEYAALKFLIGTVK